MRPKIKSQRVELPRGGGVTIPADTAYEIKRTKDSESVVLADGTSVTFVRRNMPVPAAAEPSKPALSGEQIAAGISKALRPVLAKFSERITELEARLAELERTSR